MSLRARYDAVIVGGGHNGLVAAAYLARAGRSVLVLERRHELGGAVASARPFPGVDARLSRYSYLVSLLPRLIVRELGLPLRLVRRRVSSYTPDPRVDGARGLLVGDEAPTRASFAAVTGGERAFTAWHAHHERMRALAQAVFPTLTEPLLSRDELRARVADDETWNALVERPLGETLPRALHDDLVAGVVLTDSLIGTFASADDADLRQNRCFLYHVIGGGTGEWLVPVGGMGALAAALTDAARSAGAELHTDSEVLAIDPGREGAEVRVRDGERELCVGAGHVLVNAAPVELERLLGRESDSAAPEGSQLKLNLVLSRLPRQCDGGLSPQQAFAGTLHVNESAEQLRRAHEEATAGAIPALPPCEAYCHSLADPSTLGEELRASGAHTLTVFALHMPARLFRSDPHRARESATAATIRSLESVLAEPLQECLLRTPDGDPCIEAHSPLDLEQELRMPGGHIFHRDLSWPFAEHEHEVGGWGVETDHPSILLCGSGARRGGCVSGIPGRNAAMALLDDEPRQRPAAGARMRTSTPGSAAQLPRSSKARSST